MSVLFGLKDYSVVTNYLLNLYLNNLIQVFYDTGECSPTIAKYYPLHWWQGPVFIFQVVNLPLTSFFPKKSFYSSQNYFTVKSSSACEIIVYFVEDNSFNSLSLYLGVHTEICSLPNLSFMRTILRSCYARRHFWLKKIELTNYLHLSLAIQNTEFSPNDAFWK